MFPRIELDLFVAVLGLFDLVGLDYSAVDSDGLPIEAAQLVAFYFDNGLASAHSDLLLFLHLSLLLLFDEVFLVVERLCEVDFYVSLHHADCIHILDNRLHLQDVHLE